MEKYSEGDITYDEFCVRIYTGNGYLVLGTAGCLYRNTVDASRTLIKTKDEPVVFTSKQLYEIIKNAHSQTST